MLGGGCEGVFMALYICVCEEGSGFVYRVQWQYRQTVFCID